MNNAPTAVTEPPKKPTTRKPQAATGRKRKRATVADADCKRVKRALMLVIVAGLLNHDRIEYREAVKLAKRVVARLLIKEAE